MRGDAHTVKERLNIVDVANNYLKLEKAGANFKARCPFHNEKTASFFISVSRQTYYCFGCGEKGDIFTLTEKLEGVDFKTALKQLADKAGVVLEYAPRESKGEKDRLFECLEEATKFFEDNLERSPETKAYLEKRGINPESIKAFRLGFAPDEWRSLRSHLLSKGFTDAEQLAAGLIKKPEDGKEPYDVFRGRAIFPLADASGRVIAFSGRAMGDIQPKYLNSPDTALFNKSLVLYGLDKAKDVVRKRDYAVLVEGQMDLVMSHQAGVANTVASSGTAFTKEHLERLKRLSNRILLAFDGDAAGEKAAEKSSILALTLGMEVKVAKLPEGKDPADLAKEGEAWKDALRGAKHAVEFFLDLVLEREKEPRKLGKLVEKKILPLVALIPSAIEKAHFISIIAKRTAIREEVLWDDLKKIKPAQIVPEVGEEDEITPLEVLPLRARIEKELEEVRYWQKEGNATSVSGRELARTEAELEERLKRLELEEERKGLQEKLHKGEIGEAALRRIEELSRLLDESRRKVL